MHLLVCLQSFALGSGLSGDITHYPFAAVVGGSQLVTGVENDRIMLSSAVVSGDEICFVFAASADTSSILDAQCQAVCVENKEEYTSVTYHNTALGNLPFIFIGEDRQAWSKCAQIVYPDVRAPLGWVCKDSVDQSYSKGLTLSIATVLASTLILLLCL